MSQHVAGFVTTLITHFPVRHDTQALEQEWMGSMVRNLRNYGGAVLTKAAQRIIDTRVDRRFPLVAECRKVCDEIDRFEKAAQPNPQAEIPKYAGLADWQTKLADDLIKCEMGRQAAREDWILSLHDFARKNGRLPTGSEIAKCKQGAREFDETYAQLIRDFAKLDNPTSEENLGAWKRLSETEVAGSLIKLGDSMLASRSELAARFKKERAA